MTDPGKSESKQRGDRPEDHALDAAFAESGEVDDRASVPRDGSDCEDPADQLRRLSEDLEATKQKWLLAEAEIDNMRKRAQRDQAEVRRFGSLPLIRDLLPAIDNLGRAVTAAEQSGDLNNLLEGIRMVQSQFNTALSAHGTSLIKSEGQPFDPNEHEAMTQIPSADHPPMTVVQVIEDGYKMHDRVVRPAKVIVSMEPPTDAE